jgi:TIGR03009 family protein
MYGTIRYQYVILALTVFTTASSTLAQDARKKADPPRAAAGEAAPPTPPDPAKMRAILKDWETISSKLKSLEVEIRRVDDQKGWGQEVFVGEAKLASPNLAYLNFEKVDVDAAGKPMIDKNGKVLVNPKTGKPAVKPHERIVCTGSEVWQYVVETTQIYIFPLDKEDQKRALEEGPLPFLFNMEAAKAEARYNMSLIKEEGNYYVIGVLPNLKIDQAAFSQALIRLNKKTYFPDAIMLVATDGKSTKLFTLTNPKANQQINPLYFKGQVLKAPWVVVRDPGNQQGPTPRVGDAAGAAGQPKRAAQGGTAVKKAR